MTLIAFYNAVKIKYLVQSQNDLDVSVRKLSYDGYGMLASECQCFDIQFIRDERINFSQLYLIMLFQEK